MEEPQFDAAGGTPRRRQERADGWPAARTQYPSWSKLRLGSSTLVGQALRRLPFQSPTQPRAAPTPGENTSSAGGDPSLALEGADVRQAFPRRRQGTLRPNLGLLWPSPSKVYRSTSIDLVAECPAAPSALPRPPAEGQRIYYMRPFRRPSSTAARKATFGVHAASARGSHARTARRKCARQLSKNIFSTDEQSALSSFPSAWRSTAAPAALGTSPPDHDSPKPELQALPASLIRSRGAGCCGPRTRALPRPETRPTSSSAGDLAAPTSAADAPPSCIYTHLRKKRRRVSGKAGTDSGAPGIGCAFTSWTTTPLIFTELLPLEITDFFMRNHTSDPTEADHACAFTAKASFSPSVAHGRGTRRWPPTTTTEALPNEDSLAPPAKTVTFNPCAAAPAYPAGSPKGASRGPASRRAGPLLSEGSSLASRRDLRAPRLPPGTSATSHPGGTSALAPSPPAIPSGTSAPGPRLPHPTGGRVPSAAPPSAPSALRCSLATEIRVETGRPRVVAPPPPVALTALTARLSSRPDIPLRAPASAPPGTPRRLEKNPKCNQNPRVHKQRPKPALRA
nr:proline-rich protein 36-like [Penaeus vannamei]